MTFSEKLRGGTFLILGGMWWGFQNVGIGSNLQIKPLLPLGATISDLLRLGTFRFSSEPNLVQFGPKMSQDGFGSNL